MIRRTGTTSGTSSAKKPATALIRSPFLQTPFNEHSAKFSPQGRFVAYVSDQSGQNQVYVRPFPEGEGQWQVSTKGGVQPRWSRDGKELFYVEGYTLMAVEVNTVPIFTTGATSFGQPRLSNEYSKEFYCLSSSGGLQVATGAPDGG